MRLEKLPPAKKQARAGFQERSATQGISCHGSNNLRVAKDNFTVGGNGLLCSTAGCWLCHDGHARNSPEVSSARESRHDTAEFAWRCALAMNNT